MRKTPTLLLVEDEAVIGMAETRSLEKEGYKVIHVPSGEDALEFFRKKKHPIDLILMDIDLGNAMDGTAAAREILKTHDIPVLFLSSHTEKEIVERTEKITSYGYVVKNTGMTVLNASIKMAFKLHEAYMNSAGQKMEIEAANEELQATIEQLESTNLELEQANNGLKKYQHELIEHEKVIKESEERYHALFDQSPAGVLLFDTNLICTDCNEQLAKIMGSPREKIIGVDLNGLKEQATITVLKNTIMGDVSSYEGPYHTTFSDTFTYISCTGSPIHDASGTIIGGMGVILDITQRLRTEEALKKSEAHYRLLTENMDDVVWVTDNNLRFTYISPSIRKLRGLEPEEVMRESPLETFPPESLDRLITVYTRTLPEIGKGESPCSLVEVEQYRKDGSTVWVEILIKVLRDENGKQLGFMGVSRDISERKRLGTMLLENEKRYRQLVENAGEAIVVAQDNMLKFVNPMATTLTGFSEQELCSRPFISLIHPDDRALVAERYQARLLGKYAPPVYEFRLLRKDGDIRLVEISVVSLIWESAPATLNFFKDITERKSAEMKLVESEERFRTLIESAPIAIAISRETRFVYGNRKLLHLLGYEKIEDLIGKPISTMVAEKDLTVFIERARKREEGAAVENRYQMTAVRINGARFPISATVARVELPDGPATIGFFQDDPEN